MPLEPNFTRTSPLIIIPKFVQVETKFVLSECYLLPFSLFTDFIVATGKDCYVGYR